MGQAEILAATASPSAIDAAKTTGVASAIAAATRSTVYAVGTAASGAAAAAISGASATAEIATGNFGGGRLLCGRNKVSLLLMEETVELLEHVQYLLHIHQIFAFKAVPVPVEVSTESALSVVYLVGAHARAVHRVDGFDDVVSFVQHDHIALELDSQ